jgi:hypothetical protein
MGTIWRKLSLYTFKNERQEGETGFFQVWGPVGGGRA